MSSGFFSEKEAEQNRISKQQEWERVRKPNDSKEAPLDQLRNARPLHQQLEENRVAEQEALNDSLALKNQIRGINEDESAYLNSISKAEVKIERERQREADLLIGALKRNQSKYVIRNENKPALVENAKTSDDSGIKKKKKQSSLLAGAIKRKSSADGNEPKSKESKVQENQSEEAKLEVPSPKKTTAITIPKSNVSTKSNSEPSALLSLGAQYSDSDDDKNSDTSDSDADSDGVEIRPSSKRENGKMKT